MTEPDDRVLRHVVNVASPRPDEQLSIRYTERFPRPTGGVRAVAARGRARALVLAASACATDVALRRDT